MHGHRTPAPPSPGSRAHHLQRVALLELVTAPPPGSDVIADLAARSREPVDAMHDAVDALVAAGLAASSGGVAWASPAARYFEALFPAHP